MHKLDEKALAAAAREYLSYKGERPDRILRGGYSLLEANLPAFREAISSYLAALPPEQSAAQQPATDAAATHRHKKSGGDYVLLGIGKMQTTNWSEFEYWKVDGEDVSVDMREVAIYRSVNDGSLWARPREEFEDGRFEALSQSPAKPAGDSLQQRPAAEEKRP